MFILRQRYSHFASCFPVLYTHTGMLCNSIRYVYMSSFCDYQYVLLCIFKPCSSQPQGLASLQMLDRSDPTKLRGEKSQRLATGMFMLMRVDSQALTKLRKVTLLWEVGVSWLWDDTSSFRTELSSWSPSNKSGYHPHGISLYAYTFTKCSSLINVNHCK
jgi:hypothetical protein